MTECSKTGIADTPPQPTVDMYGIKTTYHLQNEFQMECCTGDCKEDEEEIEEPGND